MMNSLVVGSRVGVTFFGTLFCTPRVVNAFGFALLAQKKAVSLERLYLLKISSGHSFFPFFLSHIFLYLLGFNTRSGADPQGLTIQRITSSFCKCVAGSSFVCFLEAKKNQLCVCFLLPRRYVS